MKIVLVHYRFFVSGGPERYMFNIMNLLSQNGHTVVPFSIKHNKNQFSEYQDFFMDAVGDGNEVYGHEYKRGIKTISKVLSRMIYSFEAKKKFKRMLLEVKPDIIYILQFQNKISCSIVDVAHDLNIPMVQRISDFAHFCINNTLYNFQENQICERCLKSSGLNAIKYKCWQKSLINSTIKALALKVQKLRGTSRKISSFVIPASFTLTKYFDFGIPRSKLYHIPTFFNEINFSEQKEGPANSFFLYFGRIEAEKGLLTLVNSVIDTDIKLYIIGFSSTGYDLFLKDYLKGKQHNIAFLGKLSFEEITPYLASCLGTICPSEWYDNFPNVILESYAYRKPVIASDLGSLQELVNEGKTGMLFSPGNSGDLRRCLEYFLCNPDDVQKMGNNGYLRLKNEYSESLHYSRLMDVFTSTLENAQ